MACPRPDTINSINMKANKVSVIHISYLDSRNGSCEVSEVRGVLTKLERVVIKQLKVETDKTTE